MNEKPLKIEEIFGPPISTYTQEQAVDDGFLIDTGDLTTGQRVFFTSKLFDEGYRDCLKRIPLVNRGLEMLKIPDAEDSQEMKLRVIEPDIWVVADGNGLTFMRPDDY